MMKILSNYKKNWIKFMDEHEPFSMDGLAFIIVSLILFSLLIVLAIGIIYFSGPIVVILPILWAFYRMYCYGLFKGDDEIR